MKRFAECRSIVCCAHVILLGGAAAAQEPTETIEVVGQTPLGAGVSAEQIPANLQIVTGEELREQRALDLADFMRRTLASVFVNEAQSNPLQPDLQYRGFVGSPLLGLPQGIAVYQDGVRINEPFGDTVNWALIPDSAIDTVYLMPGSNPLFGLNALGGAISIDTKDGFTNSGTRAEILGGSFGRMALEAETGAAVGDGFSYFFTGKYLEEDGWRDYSGTEAVQAFSKLAWQLGRTAFDVSLNVADTDLVGNGPAPVELLDIDRSAIFTRPDRTENELALLSLSMEREASESLSLTGNFYVRRSDVSTYNGDDSDFEACDAAPEIICMQDGDSEEIVFDRTGQTISYSEALIGATVNRTATKQHGTGFGFQAAWNSRPGSRANLFVIGLAYDDADIEFNASTELGTLDATRLAVPGGVLVGDSFTAFDSDSSTLGIFLSDTLSLTDGIALTLSGRFNDTHVTLNDRIGTQLDGDHEFDRFNPAVGLTADLGADVTFYAGYNESNRAPTPVELTCADEDDPCRLPNAFLADPPLEQVVAETFELGVRGSWSNGQWQAGMFRTTNRDDIIFISAGALTNQGFFDNVGRTRRDGVELSIQATAGEGFRWFANYTFLDATFRESIALPSPNNPAAIAGEVQVSPGDRLPLVPSSLFKGGVDFTSGRFSIGAEVVAGGGFHMRGDEGNDLGRIGDFVVVNLRAGYQLSERLRLFANLDNLTDERYESFGLFGEPDEVLGDDFEDPRFLSAAAPRAVWLGAEIEF